MHAGNRIYYFTHPLLAAVKSGEVPEAVINDKARRILYVMAAIHKIDGARRKTGSRNTPEHQKTVREIAESAIVLLKNDGNILPLDRKAVKTILLVGENAEAKHCQGGGSSGGKPPYEITPREGIERLLGPTVKIECLPMIALQPVKPIPETCVNVLNVGVKEPGVGNKVWQTEYFNNVDFKGRRGGQGIGPHAATQPEGDVPAPGVNRNNFAVRWTSR